MEENAQATKSFSTESNNYALSGKVMLICAIVSFTVCILVIVIHFYYRHFNLDRHPSTSHPRFSIRNHSLTSKGLARSVLQSLPVFVYSAAQEPLECAICLMEFQENQSGRILPKCTHVFHVQCIDTWFLSHIDCPLCRATIQAPNNLINKPVDASGSYPDTSESSSVVHIGSPSLAEQAIDIPMETGNTRSGTGETGGPISFLRTELEVQ